jgi:P2 family phage major capsid protein
MKTKTKEKYLSFCIAMAATYGVTSVAENFDVNPTIGQVLQDAIAEEDTFLKMINTVPVDEIKGQKVLGGVSGIVGKRTNTETNDRVPQSVLTLGSKDYELYSTEFDTYITWAMLDSWAKFLDFNERYGKYVRRAIAMARVKTGWYGTHAAAVTDADTYPNGEDVNKGWFQILRDYNSGAQWFDGSVGTAVEDEIRIGAGGDFVNLDAAAHACKQMIHPNYRDGTDLVLLVGSELLALDKAALYEAQGDTPSEKERIANEKVTRTYAGMKAITPSGFPGRGMMITSLDNLSFYYQSGSQRRQVKDKPERNRIEDFNSANEGYVIEDEKKAAAFDFENVKLKSGASWV